jgi:hypothetical protein
MGPHGVGGIQVGVDAEEFYRLPIIREGGFLFGVLDGQAMEARGMMWVASVAVV